MADALWVLSGLPLAMEYHALSLWYIFVDSDIEQRSWIAFGIDILD